MKERAIDKPILGATSVTFMSMCWHCALCARAPSWRVSSRPELINILV